MHAASCTGRSVHVQPAEYVFDERSMQRVGFLRDRSDALRIAGCPSRSIAAPRFATVATPAGRLHPFLDHMQRRHQQRPCPARRIHDAQPRHRLLIAPVAEVRPERKPRQHERGQVVGVEGSVGGRVGQDPVVERSGVVIPQRAQRVGHSIGALGEDTQRVDPPSAVLATRPEPPAVARTPARSPASG